MKNRFSKTAALFLAALFAGSPDPAEAHGNNSVDGSWAGTAFANASLDLNGDGIHARTFVLPAYGQGRFDSVEGVTDTELVSLGSCGGPGSLELQPFGTFSFRGKGEDVLFVTVDPAAPNLCFSAANPDEALSVVVIGGRGRYAGARGSGSLRVRDVVLVSRPVDLPGFPTLPAPLVVDSQGDFSLTLR